MGGKQNGVSDMPTQMFQDGRHEGSAPNAPTEGRAQDPFEHAVRAALEADRIADARTMVANAEAVLAAHSAVTEAEVARASFVEIAGAKARIAIATGDGAAARAILVQAIERSPQSTTLRALMTEVMMAAGRATDVRPVLQHLGHKPMARQDPDDIVPPTASDTLG